MMALAIVHTHTAVLRLLVEHGGDVNMYVSSLNEVPGYNYKDGSIALPGAPSFDDAASSLLALATVCACMAQGGHEEDRRRQRMAATAEAVQILLDADGINVNASDVFGRTPLMVAARASHLAVVRLILGSRHSVDPNRQDAYGGTALIFAVTALRVDIVELLLGAKADPNQQNSRGRTALMFAVRGRGRRDPLRPASADIVRLLLQANADTNKQDGAGTTALMLARNVDVIRQLMAAGADPQLRDAQNLRASDTALPRSLKRPNYYNLAQRRNRADYLADVSPVVINTSAVVAALVATLSYSSLLSPPGGWSGGVEAPAASSPAFIAFMLFVPLALFASLASLFMLLYLHLIQYKWSYCSDRIFRVDEKRVSVRKVREYTVIGRTLANALILLLAAVAALVAAGVAAYFVMFVRPHPLYVPSLAAFVACVAVAVAGWTIHHMHSVKD